MLKPSDGFFPSYLKIRREGDISFIMNEDLQLFSLNNTAMEIYDLFIERNLVGDVINFLVAHYDISEKTAKNDVENFIKEMVGYDLLKGCG